MKPSTLLAAVCSILLAVAATGNAVPELDEIVSTINSKFQNLVKARDIYEEVNERLEMAKKGLDFGKEVTEKLCRSDKQKRDAFLCKLGPSLEGKNCCKYRKSIMLACITPELAKDHRAVQQLINQICFY